MAIKDLFFTIFAKDKTAQAFTSVNKRLRETEGYAASFSERLSRTGQSLQRMGATATVAVAPVGIALRGVVRASAEWEAALNRSSALLKPTTAQTAALEKVTRDLGRTTAFSAGQAADAVEVLARNGLDAAQILGGALPSSLTVASVGGTQLGSAADVVTDAMVSFRIAADSSAMVADELAAVMSKSKFVFDDYRLALGQAGGVAGGLDVEFRDFNTTLAATASLFASGSDAGTSFKTFLTRLVPESKGAREAFDQMGFSAFDAAGNMKSMDVIAGELADGLSKLSEEDRTAALRNAFGTDAMRTAIGLAEVGVDGFRKLRAEMDSVSSAELVEARMEGATGAMTRLSSAVNGLQIAIGASGLLDLFTSLVSGLTNVVNWLGETSPAALRFTAVLAGLAVVVAPLVLVFGGLAAALGAVSAPIGLVVTGLGVLMAAVVALAPSVSDMAGGIRDAFARMPEWAQAMAQGVIDALKSLLNPFALVRRQVEMAEASFAWLYDRVVGNSWVPDLVDEIGEHFGRLSREMVTPTDDATAAVDSSFADLSGGVSGRLKQLARDGELTWNGFLGALEDTARERVNAITGQIFDKLTDTAFSGVEGFVGNILGGSSGAGSGGGGGVLSSVGSALGGLLGFNTGGAFTVRGREGVDRNVAAVRLSEGERVEVLRRGERQAQPITINISTPDVESFRRSRGQVAAQLRAALAAGGRVS